MPKRHTGDFCWVELCTKDAPAALSFYKTVFNWGQNDHNNGDHGTYHMLMLGEHEIAGAYQLTPELQQQGAYPCWNAYVKVADVDAVADKAKSLGGRVLNGPFDVVEHGRMAILQDPTGAVFSLWQSKHEADHPEKQQPGNFGWVELMTKDTQKAGAFYQDLFGWQAETAEFAGVNYTSFSIDGEYVGGMLQTRPEWGEIPANWSVYFTVADIDKTLTTAKDLGADLCYDVKEIPEVGRFTTFKDPQGVYVSVIEYPKAS